MASLFPQQQRGRSQKRSEDAVALAGMELLGVTRKDGADRFGMREDHIRAVAAEVERECVSQAANALVQKVEGLAQPAQRLLHCRELWPRRKDGCRQVR